MSAPDDTWQRDAMKRLLGHVVSAPRRERDYAPDCYYDGVARIVKSGAKTLAISDALQRWASMWAQDMREAKNAGIELNQDAEWSRCMSEADAEIDRYLAAKAA